MTIFNSKLDLNKKTPDDNYENYKIFHRPGRTELLDYLFMQRGDFYEVGKKFYFLEVKFKKFNKK